MSAHPLFSSTFVRYFASKASTLLLMTALLGMLLPSIGQAQPSKSPAGSPSYQEIRASLVLAIPKVYPNDAAYKRLIQRAYGAELTPFHMELSLGLMKEVVNHPRFPDLLAGIITPVYRPDMSHAEIQALVLEGVGAAQVKGFSRLPQERQESFVQMMMEMMRAVPPEDCKRMIQGTMSSAESARLERSYLLTISPERYRDAVMVYREATLAELTGYPLPTTVTADQERLAGQALERVMVKNMAARIPREVLALYNSNQDAMNPRDVCEIGTIVFESMLSLQEPYRRWMLASFIARL